MTIDLNFMFAFIRPGDGEIVVVLAVLFVLFGSKHFPKLIAGMIRGFSEFLNASRGLRDSFDGAGFDAGRSVGGIYGKSAHQALSVENKTAELYDPSVLQDEKKIDFLSRVVFFRQILKWAFRVAVIALIAFLFMQLISVFLK